MFIVAAGCSDNKNKDGLHHARSESAINILVDRFKSDYASATSIKARDSVMSSYQTKTDEFLSSHYLNHMRVHIDSVVINQRTIDTKFHAGKSLVFISSIEFRKHKLRVEDSLYQFMKGLRQGTDTNIDFMYIGKFELHRPDDTLHPVLIVNAYPLSYQVHGRR